MANMLATMVIPDSIDKIVIITLTRRIIIGTWPAVIAQGQESCCIRILRRLAHLIVVPVLVLQQRHYLLMISLAHLILLLIGSSQCQLLALPEAGVFVIGRVTADLGHGLLIVSSLVAVNG